MDIFLRGCAGGGDPGGEIFQASLQYCQVQSRRRPGKTRHVVQKWIRNPILHVSIRLIKLKKAHLKLLLQLRCSEKCQAGERVERRGVRSLE